MKKIFVWALALALVLTVMPVLGVHNSALAVELGDPCVNCGNCHGYKPPSWVSRPGQYPASKCTKCGCMGKLHYVPQVECTYDDTPDFTVEATCMHGGYEAYSCLTCTRNHWDHRNEVPKDPNAHHFVNGFCDNEDDNGNKCTAHQHQWKNGVCVRVEGCDATHDHTDNNFKVDADSIVDGTCTASKTWKLVCDVCGASKTETGEKDPTNHSWKIDGTCANGCDAKCEHETYEDNKCAVCGCPDHVHPDEAFTDTLKTPGNCVKGAVYTRTYACGATEAVTGKIDPNAHTWAPTGQCANTGCNQACTHKWADGVCTKCTFACVHAETTQTTTVPGNCKNVGSADLICDECGEVADTVELPIDEDNHDWTVFPFGAGYCNRCGEINVNYDDFEDVLPEEKPVENPCKEHQWASLAFGAWYCTKCGATATDINPLEPEICDHADTYINVIKAATCKKEGSAEKICDICETVLDANVVLPIDKENGHDLVIFPFGASWCNLCHEINVDYEDFIEPENPQDSCDHEWVSFPFGVWLCPKCMLQTEEDPTVPVEPEEPKYCENNEHQWASLAFGAWYCTKCGLHATDIKPLDPDKCDHADTYIDVTTPATCVATGIGNKMCDICETVMEEGVEVAIDPDAHQWGTDANGNACCLLCGLYESELPEEEPCEHEWAAVATGWYCWKCNSVTLDNPFATEPVVLLGDVNDDGVVDGRDEVRLMKYLVGQDVHINKLNADLNGDGVIDGRDEIRLLYRLL